MRNVVERVEVKAYRIPTEEPESDGTCLWDETVMVAVHLYCKGVRGFGYSYAHESAATLIRDRLGELVRGRDPFDIPGCRLALNGALRNLGDAGIGMMAVSAVDAALWDLKARLLELPLVSLLGGARESVPVYGSGGFTSYTVEKLERQLSGWAERGITRVKMKVGRDPVADPERVAAARRAIGQETGLMVDANGGYARKEALRLARLFAAQGVDWFEEPVSHRDREGLRLVRDLAPEGMEVSSGEYGFNARYFLDLLRDGCVDVMQADATRCGVTGFLEAAALCEAWHIPLSSHCAPALHLHLCCTATSVRHLEYFHDHVRIERRLLEGVVEPHEGSLFPDLTRHGHGLSLREDEAKRFEIRPL
ncbi:enolase C-terminal domain-like protein [Geomonas oryzae]|uniref:enolase C-terminal domain-like protein n=1 Tax=Geomonas oryzae TaxID=2364273 RepID=UPI00100BEE8B|nr:enolase C-terminal domain-like protein [Geomonas oryzae]